MTPFVSLVIMAFGGFILGWVYRSLQFAYDEECCNPRHPQEEDHEL